MEDFDFPIVHAINAINQSINQRLCVTTVNWSIAKRPVNSSTLWEMLSEYSPFESSTDQTHSSLPQMAKENQCWTLGREKEVVVFLHTIADQYHTKVCPAPSWGGYSFFWSDFFLVRTPPGPRLVWGISRKYPPPCCCCCSLVANPSPWYDNHGVRSLHGDSRHPYETLPVRWQWARSVLFCSKNVWRNLISIYKQLLAFSCVCCGQACTSIIIKPPPPVGENPKGFVGPPLEVGFWSFLSFLMEMAKKFTPKKWVPQNPLPPGAPPGRKRKEESPETCFWPLPFVNPSIAMKPKTQSKAREYPTPTPENNHQSLFLVHLLVLKFHRGITFFLLLLVCKVEGLPVDSQFFN